MNAPWPSEIWPVKPVRMFSPSERHEVDRRRRRAAAAGSRRRTRGRTSRTTTPTTSAATRRASGARRRSSYAPHHRRRRARSARTSRTTRMTSSAAGSRSSAPTKSTYAPSRLRPTPSSSPPTTAPTGRRCRRAPRPRGRRAGSAASCSGRGRRSARPASRDGAEHRREPPAQREHPAHAHADEPARVRVDAAARSARPSFVKRKNANSSDDDASETAMTPRSCGEIATPPTSTGPRRERALERARLPRPRSGGGAVEPEQQADGDDHDRQHRAALDRPDDGR